mmetsp:Transcript_13620/g.25991  ORF Transcript_13620/g.25991 Transcript_13620/m.25991 type:complete len:116 (-) Transcript_13620:283-630(-)
MSLMAKKLLCGTTWRASTSQKGQLELFEFGEDDGKGSVTFTKDVGEAGEKLDGIWKIDEKTRKLVLEFNQRWEAVGEDGDDGDTEWAQDKAFVSKTISFQSLEEFRTQCQLYDED